MKLLLFVLCGNIFLALPLMAQEKIGVVDVDKFVIYEPEYSRKTIDSQLEIFDNKDLKGNPVFIVNNKLLTDLRVGKKEYVFQDFCRKKESFEIKGESDSGFIVKKPFPINFVRLDRYGYVIPIEFRLGDILKVEGESLYFKATKKEQRGIFDGAMIWRQDNTLNAVRKLIKDDNVFGRFMGEFASCVKNKDAECLFSLDKKYKLNSGFANGVNQFDNLFRIEECKNDPVVKKREGSKEKHVVNWDLYQLMIDLKNKKVSSAFTVSEFGDGVSLSLTAEGVEVCGEESQIIIEYTKHINSEATFHVITTSPDA